MESCRGGDTKLVYITCIFVQGVSLIEIATSIAADCLMTTKMNTEYSWRRVLKRVLESGDIGTACD